VDVQLTPELEQKLHELAMLSGRPAQELVREAVAGMVDELAETRDLLDRRYDDVKGDRVKLIDGEEALARLTAKNDTDRKRHP
jgi:hypothetical protein